MNGRHGFWQRRQARGQFSPPFTVNSCGHAHTAVIAHRRSTESRYRGVLTRHIVICRRCHAAKLSYLLDHRRPRRHTSTARLFTVERAAPGGNPPWAFHVDDYNRREYRDAGCGVGCDRWNAPNRGRRRLMSMPTAQARRPPPAAVDISRRSATSLLGRADGWRGISWLALRTGRRP